MEFKELTKKDAQISLSMGKDEAFIVFVNIVDQDECPQAFPCKKEKKKCWAQFPNISKFD